MDDAAFLSAILAAHPTERYDWYMPTGSSAETRARIAAIEEEMRQLPVFSDRFWHLKKRRNELRRQVPSEWLEAMAYGTNCEPVFVHGVPDSWKERWRLIREFTERWHQIPLPDVGGRLEDIWGTELVLGRRLPQAIQEWVAFFFDVDTSTTHLNGLCDRYTMEELTGQPAVSLLCSCREYHLGVCHDDFGVGDPVVHGFYWNQHEGIFTRDNPSHIHLPVTAASILEHVMGSVQGEGGGFITEIVESDDAVNNLRNSFPSIANSVTRISSKRRICSFGCVRLKTRDCRSMSRSRSRSARS